MIPSIPIQDGQVKVPDIMECASLRICSGDTQTTIPYERGQMIDVEDGTVLQFLSPGAQVMQEIVCIDPESDDPNVTVVLTDPAPDDDGQPEPDSKWLTEDDLNELRSRRQWDDDGEVTLERATDDDQDIVDGVNAE